MRSSDLNMINGIGTAIIFSMENLASLKSQCLHCGTSFNDSKNKDYCCPGCEQVAKLIRDQGLDNFYSLRNANPPSCPTPVTISDLSYAFCDDPEFIRRLGPDQSRIRFFIEGLNCTACLWLLEKLPDYCPEVEWSKVNMASSTIEVRKKSGASFSKIAQKLNQLGYKPHPLRESESVKSYQTQERRRDLIRIGISGALTGNIMILAVSLYGGAEGDLASQLSWLAAFLSIPVLSYCAWPFYKSAWASLKSKHLNLDVPIVLALISGVVLSVWGLATEGTVYFDSLSMLVFLLLSSRLILKTIQNKHLQSENIEDDLLLSTVTKKISVSESIQVSSLSLKKDDVIQVKGRMAIPIDGIVEAGSGYVDVSVLTGESEPQTITAGDLVEAGSRSLFGTWFLKVTNPPSETRLAKILHDTEESAKDKSRFLKATDSVSQYFIISVLGISLLVIAFFFTANPQEGLSRALTLMIVTCPCVFGIAIPLSMGLTIRSAARQGIIVKNSNAIERLWSIDTLFFDKTGTLTTGKMSVLNSTSTSALAGPIALGLEKNQDHPVGRAITKFLELKAIKLIPFSNVTPHKTGGVFAEENHHHYSIRPKDSEQESKPETLSVVRSEFAVYLDKTEIGSFELGDTPRPESKSVIAWARENNFKVRLISGDKPHPVTSCGKYLGFQTEEIHSQVTPEMKSTILKITQEKSAMIGDGVNDAAALATASVGIAVCGSIDVSLRAADIYLLRPNLNSIPVIFKIAQETKKAIRRNLIFSASFNIFSGTLAVLGLMTPLWAAVLMPLSSLVVLMSATWTGRKINQLGEQKI